MAIMIAGVHALVHSKHAAEVQAFLRDVLGFAWVDAGNGRLMFAGPPLELAVHETADEPEHELYFICDDVHATVAALEAKGVHMAHPVVDRGWGLVTAIVMPGGEQIGLYEQRHRSPLRAGSADASG